MCDPILVTLLKMQPHYSQSSRENATPSSGTSPVASYKEVPPPGAPLDTITLINNYSMSPRWIWSDKITNERVARVGYNHFISNEGEWNNCFSKFSNRVLPPIFISTIFQSENF